MAVDGLGVAYVVAGFIFVFSGYKNASVKETLTSLLKGQEPAQGPSQGFGVGLESVGNSTGSAGSTMPSTGTAVNGLHAQSMLNFMMAQIGHPYSENTATNPSTGQEYRFGPTEYDCSGLVYAAAHHAGINLPAQDAIASSEAVWFAAQPGAKTILSESQVQPGDLVFFIGASPDPSKFGPIGHVGMVDTSTQYVSAYDTQAGVALEPLSQDHFVVAVRLGS